MDLELRRYEDVEAFTAAAMPFLMEREAEHNLFIGICGQIAAGRYTEAYLASVHRDGRTVAAAFRTPPFNLGLSCIDDPVAVRLIAQDAFTVYETLPGTIGPRTDAKAFAEAWQALSGQTFTLAMEQRIYEATEATSPFDVSGEMRPARRADRETCIRWFDAFHDEVGGIMGDTAENVDRRLTGDDTSGLDVWWDEDIVSMTGYGAPTPNGIRIGPVYTPPELRGRGYASACVAATTKRLLESGHRFVFLFTDLANPISNSIYQRIGYRPVCDVDQYRFDA